MDEFAAWEEYFKENPEYYPKLLEAGKKFQLQYQFPKPLDKNECQESTIEFVLSKLNIDRYAYVRFLDNVPAYNPVYEIYCKEYPLPIGRFAISSTYFRKQWYWTDLYPFDQQPLVENDNAFIGLAKKFTSGETIGWFLGLVKVYDQYMNTSRQLGELSDDERMYVYFHPPFEFIEGMILLEGKLEDDLVNIPLRNYVKYYNKNILGKVVTGRPFSKETESIVEAARMAIKEYPLDKLLMIANQIGIPERTLQFHIKRSKYKSWKGLHDSVINNE